VAEKKFWSDGPVHTAVLSELLKNIEKHCVHGTVGGKNIVLPTAAVSLWATDSLSEGQGGVPGVSIAVATSRLIGVCGCPESHARLLVTE
jgi:hypothetical protein